MKCQKCNKESTINFKHLGNLCDNCFINIIQKRVKKELRNKWNFKKDQRILIVENDTKEGKVNVYLAQLITNKLPALIDIKNNVDLDKELDNYDIIFIPWSLDNEVEEFLSEVFKNEIFISKYKSKVIKLLRGLSEEEIEMIAKIKNISFIEEEKSELEKFIENIEKKYPGSKFALLKSKEIID